MTHPTIVALAGQRIDAPGRPTPRFPSDRAGLVADRIRRTFIELDAGGLVCSAACGADLLALEAAGALGLRRHVVLPFDAGRFRETSVADRPGQWTVMFDRIVGELLPTGDVETMQGGGTDSERYAAANVRILDVAQSLAAASGAEPVAVVVWDRAAAGDWYTVTEKFIDEARRRSLRIVEISTTVASSSSDD